MRAVPTFTMKDEHKVTTLLQASHRGMNNVTKALLSKNSKTEWVNSASDENITPLVAASSEGHLDIVKMLIDAKADVSAKDKDETSSLMAAAARGHTDIVEALLKAGTNVDDQNLDGNTALVFGYNGKNQVETLWERYKQFVQESEMRKAPLQPPQYLRHFHLGRGQFPNPEQKHHQPLHRQNLPYQL